MVHFRDIFRRTKRRTAECKEASTQAKELTAEHVEHGGHLNIAAMPVAGMQRSNHGTYITTYTSTTLSQGTSRTSSSEISTTSDSSKTAVETDSTLANEQSVWKGTPKGTTYDKREELSEEDKDMWANMAM